ncbi:MAG: CHAT domain-containing protein [Deltaproteobacteria bacterium]|nr:CHAT domain-containing protein [Deltaproteobacteria bacterium]
MRFTSRLIIIAGLLPLAGCVYGGIPERERLAASAKYEEARKITEAQIRETGHASSAKLTVLCVSYAGLKRYDRLFQCYDLLEQNIKRGDKASTDLDELARESPILGGMARSKYADNPEMLGDITYLPHVLRAEAYIDLAQYPQAVAEAKKAYFFVDRMAQIRILGTLGLAYALNGERARALQMADRLDRLQMVNPVMKANRNFITAKIYVALNDFRKALEAIRQTDPTAHVLLADLFYGAMMHGESLAVYEEIPRKFMLSKCLMETGSLSEAGDGYDALLNMPQTRDNGEIYWMILFDRGKIAAREGNFKAAVDFYSRAVEVIEQQRSTINTESSKIGFVGDKQALYFDLVQALYQEKQYEKAFEYVERAKSRALVDLLAAKKDFAVRGGDKNAIKAALAMNDTAEAEAIIQDASLDKSRSRSVQIKVREELKGKDPELASLITVTSQPIAELRAHLPQDEALIEYYYSGGEMYAFVLSAGGLSAVKLDSRGLADDVQEFRKCLEDPGSPRFVDSARRLYDRLFKPIDGQVNRKNLTVVPHGALHYLPFNALHDGTGFLIDRYSIRVMPSASAMKYLASKAANKTGDILVFGNPDLGDARYDLSFAEKEAVDVAKSKTQSKVFLRKEATMGAFIKHAGNFRYIHFATHGRFDSSSPLKSALLLAPEAGSNGMLTADKLYSLELNADLVTLSACETGLSMIANGDDLVGLTRGFLYAGSASIVASLWKVDDLATSQLMGRFYRELDAIDKREALRTAQLETRKTYSHPYYWASFQLTGNAN